MNKFLFLLSFVFINASCENRESTNQSSVESDTSKEVSSSNETSKESTEWIPLFNGNSLDNWKISENPDAFKVEDGIIIVNGERGHLFYDGPVENHDFKNFEFKADVMTFPGANSGIFIHTEYQDTDWPSKGYEIQVNNTQSDWRRTGSIYAVQDIKEAPARDNEWFTQHIIVDGDQITVKINDKVVNEYKVGDDSRLSSGTFALQAHDPDSKVHYKNIMVKVLPD